MDGMETRTIQKSLIDAALKLTTAQAPSWRIVAARLLLMDIKKDLVALRGYAPSTRYAHHASLLVSKGLYDSRILNTWPLEWFEGITNEDAERSFDYAGVNMLRQRYLVRDNGVIVESVGEMFLTVAILLMAQHHDAWGHKADKLPRERVVADVQKTFDLLISRKISLATPLLRNLRRVGGSLTSCFVLQMDDSRDSIFYTIDQIARISKNGGGVGLDVSPVRAKGSPVNGMPGVSGGVIPWVRIANDTFVAVNQGGARAGAGTIALRIWHKDILDFLDLQTENGDQRRKAFDIYPQVVIHDLFMRRVEEGGMWTLVCPYEVKTILGEEYDLVDTWGPEFERRYLEVEKAAAEGRLPSIQFPARKMVQHITEVQIETGLPYICFIDTINRMNPNKGDGMIPAANLCTESFSNVKRTVVGPQVLEGTKIVQAFKAGYTHCCNLLSENLAEILDGELAEVTHWAVKILDASVDLTLTPTPEAKLHNDWYRTIGVGVMGWADWLARRDIMYDSPEALVEANRVFEQIAYHSYVASHALAFTHGSFGAFESSDQKKGILFGKTGEELAKMGNLGEKWIDLTRAIQQDGCRHSQVLAIAPTTSTSLIQGCTSSMLPPYGKFFFDKNGGQTVPICPPYLEEKFWYYKEFRQIDQKAIVNMTATIQKWIDTGISMELLFDLNDEKVTAKYIYSVIAHAWKNGVKCVYYVRSVQKALNREEACVSCSG
jgi:ribonucleoside-diphosphate reductase alpha chain